MASAPPPYTPPPLDRSQCLPANVEKVMSADMGAISMTVQAELARYATELQSISLKISDHPELAYHEIYAHDLLTKFLIAQDLDVTPSYVLKTAFRAQFTYPPSFESEAANDASLRPSAKPSLGGKSSRSWLLGQCWSKSYYEDDWKLHGNPGLKTKGRKIVLQSEYDALPGIGHACGHNLIAISGVAILLALRAAMIKHRIPGTVVLLGTPAEEGGGGKIPLIASGAYDGADACLMCHPGPGPTLKADNWGSIRPSLAIQTLNVEYHGKAAHAASEPWEGINALDAAILAYSSISALRQQLAPGDRVHGIITDGGKAPNIIPDFASLKYFIRSPSLAGLEALRKRIDNCFNSAALATGAKVEIRASPAHFDQRNVLLLAKEFKKVMHTLYDQDVDIAKNSGEGGGGGGSFSTDFGNVTYAVPSLGTSYAIPTFLHGGNHTPLFTAQARTPEAHGATLKAAAGLSMVAARVLVDKEFALQVKTEFKEM